MTVGPRYGAATPRARMLAADSDRDHAVGLLKTAFTDGRLSKDEYGARVEHALTARTYADLDTVTAGLPPYGAGATPPTNPLAIVSLCCGIAQVALWPLATIPAIVCGHMALRQIRRTGEAGTGLAVAGLVLGWLWLAVEILLALGFVFLVVAVAHAGHAVVPTGGTGGPHAVPMPGG